MTDISKASTGLEFTRHWFAWFPVISPHTLPPASREIPSCSPQKESPQDSPGKGSTTHPHPPSTHTHTPTTPTQREREGKTNLPQIDQNHCPRENHKRTPQNHKRPLRREGRLWFSINVVYDFAGVEVKGKHSEEAAFMVFRKRRLWFWAQNHKRLWFSGGHA